MENWSFFFLFEAGGRSEASRDRLAAAPVARCDETQRDASCSRPRWGSSHSGTEQVPFSSVPELNQGKRTKEYSECSYILRLFPWKHPLHESDISFTEWCPSSGCATLPSTPPPSLWLSLLASPPAPGSPYPSPPLEPEEGPLMVFSYHCGSLKKKKNPQRFKELSEGRKNTNLYKIR